MPNRWAEFVLPDAARVRVSLRGATGLVLLLVALPFAVALSRDSRTDAAAAAPRRMALAAAPVSLDRPSGPPVLLASRERAVRASRATRASRAARRTTVAGAKWVRPARGIFSSGFKRRWGRMHKGVDFSGPTGAPVYAAADGRVTFAGRYSSFGKLILIRHKAGVVTAYAHLSSIDTEVGDKVKAGKRIGKIGSTGHSTGPHLHFEVRINGAQIDPQKFLRERGIWL